MKDSGGTWFGSETGRNDHEAEFLGELRRLAGGWDIADMDPGEHTSAEVFLAPLYIGCDVPGVTVKRNNLQLGYWTGSEHWLQGEWGTDYLLDDHDGNSPECLTVRGVVASPREFARFAADWMRTQLQRPLVREEWMRGEAVIATRWRFLDTGHVLAREAVSVRRLLRRPPDRVVPVRGTSAS